MKKEMLKGVVMRNLLFLVIFFMAYFPLVLTGYFMKDTLCNAVAETGVFETDCDDIPAYTTALLGFLLFGVVPFGAILWAIFSMSQPTYQPYQ